MGRGGKKYAHVFSGVKRNAPSRAPLSRLLEGVGWEEAEKDPGSVLSAGKALVEDVSCQG